MYEELEKHRVALADWFNNNGYNAEPNTGPYECTLRVNDHDIWHEVHDGWIHWFVDQCTDHSVRLDWTFRISADFLLSNRDWEKQAKYIIKMIEMNDEWDKFQENFIGVGRK